MKKIARLLVILKVYITNTLLFLVGNEKLLHFKYNCTRLKSAYTR